MSSNFGIQALSQVFNDSSREERSRVIGIYSFLVGFNVLAWILTLIAFGRSPALLLLALTAYTFGLRHAFDADHILAIDNVTRKLRPFTAVSAGKSHQRLHRSAAAKPLLDRSFHGVGAVPQRDVAPDERGSALLLPQFLLHPFEQHGVRSHGN